jgi:hypothetical protein
MTSHPVIRRRAVCVGALALPLCFGAAAAADREVPIDPLGGDRCVMFSRLVPKQLEGNHYVALPLHLVIDNEHDFRALFEPGCAAEDLSAALARVDFSRQTVLGSWYAAPCFVTGFDRKVTRDDQHKVIRYTVTALGAVQACMEMGPQSLNLVAIAKIPAGYKVEFDNRQAW